MRLARNFEPWDRKLRLYCDEIPPHIASPSAIARSNNLKRIADMRQNAVGHYRAQMIIDRVKHFDDILPRNLWPQCFP